MIPRKPRPEGAPPRPSPGRSSIDRPSPGRSSIDRPSPGRSSIDWPGAARPGDAAGGPARFFSDDDAVPADARPKRPGLSLKGRALRYLSQREHSRIELRRKLAPHAESAEQLDALLDTLQAERLLSETRFVESLVRRRSERFGIRRIQQELGQHQLDQDLQSAALAQLRGTEAERALVVWRRRFDAPPADLSERARQHRFLAARGFDSAAISAVFRRIASSDYHPDD